MKDIVYIAVIAIFVLATLLGVVYSMRLFSNATTPLILHQPKPGITCATMVTSDGAAISCWKD